MSIREREGGGGEGRGEEGRVGEGRGGEGRGGEGRKGGKEGGSDGGARAKLGVPPTPSSLELAPSHPPPPKLPPSKPSLTASYTF